MSPSKAVSKGCTDENKANNNVNHNADTNGMDEFGLIKHFFDINKTSDPAQSGVSLGIGDDAAELAFGNSRLVVATDTLNCGIHFPEDALPEQIATRAVAVNISDFAAMAARPRWATLSLTIPEVNKRWLDAFSSTLFSSLKDAGVVLVGGDTTKGSLAVSLTIMGEPFTGRLLRRDAASSEDDIWLSGYTGLGAAGLAYLQGKVESGLSYSEVCLLQSRFYQPESRLRLSQLLAAYANAAIDISDGLLADAGHIAQNSGCQIRLANECIPVHPVMGKVFSNEVDQQRAILAGGDDYELLFTAAVEHRDAIQRISEQLKIPLCRIGSVEKTDSRKTGVLLLDRKNQIVELNTKGYKHF